MQSFYLIYVVSLFIASAINAALAVYSWYSYNTREARAFALMLISVAIITVSAALSAISATFAAADFWLTKIRFIGVVSLPIFFLAFIFEYEGRIRLLARRYLPLLFIIPTITMILIWTNDYHHLFLREISYQQYGSFIMRDSWTPGIWFWIHSIYCYVFMLYGIIILGRKIFHTYYPWRGQVILMFIGSLLPMLANVLAIIKVIPGIFIDLTAFGATITCVVFFLALYRYHLLHIMPVAGEKIIENMKDAVIVLDNRNRIIHLNPSMMAIIVEGSTNDVIGKLIKDALPRWLHKIDAVTDKNQFQVETFVVNNEQDKYFEINSTPLYQRQESAVIGQLIVLHDITRPTLLMKERENLIDKLKKTQIELKELAITDSLTGLYNRRHFFHLAEQEFRRSVRYGRPLSIMMSDVDFFKKINDSHGHAAGDHVLSLIAQVFKNNIRNADILARFGGEEFIILLPETNISVACGIADRIRIEIAANSILVKNNIIKTSVSIGLATLDDDAASMEELIKKADAAMYRAKEKGRNQVSL